MFYQRLPYVSIGKYKQITRLIGLAGVNSIKDKNKKWLHALQVQPSNEQSVDDKKNIEIPAGTTQNPYLTFVPFQRDARTEPMTKKQRIVGGLSAEQVAHLKTQSANEARQFFFDSKFASKGQQQQLQFDRHKTHHHPKVSERTECWFCLSTPSVERHLIVSIGMEAYLAIPKGAIVPDHILIIPIVHESSVMRLSDACIEEINKFKQALKKMFASQNKEIILFDRNIATIGATHTHLQIVPVPKTNATHAREIFEQEGAKYNVKFEVIQEDEDLHKVTDGREYFYAEVPDGKRGHVRLIHIVQEKQYMQFGRHAAAMVLEMPRHANWKYCVVSKEEEIEMTQTFKKMFQPYDFSLEDDDEV
jgi:diadenosine tetraphosphate (Ap4A) HIT family hydrolase